MKWGGVHGKVWKASRKENIVIEATVSKIKKKKQREKDSRRCLNNMSDNYKQ